MMKEKKYGLPPRISVILPVYNAGKFLKAAVESVLEQTFTDFELLMLNDGSTDSSLEVLKYYADQDPRCKVFSWSNRGLIETLNEGIRLSSSELIFRMDADDVCVNSRFEKQVEYLLQHPECVAVGSKVLLIDDEDLPIIEFSTKTEHENIDEDHMNGRGGSICHPAVAIRKKALLHIGGYNNQYLYAEDLDLFLRLAEVGKLANLPDVLLKYRQHIDSIGYSKKAEQLASNKQAVTDAWKRRSMGKPINFCIDKKASTADSTAADVHRKWVWWALSAGNLKTARKHLLKAIKLNPLNIKNLRLLYCVLRGS